MNINTIETALTLNTNEMKKNEPIGGLEWLKSPAKLETVFVEIAWWVYNHFIMRSQLKLPNTLEDLNTSCLIRSFFKSLQFVEKDFVEMMWLPSICKRNERSVDTRAYSYLSLVFPYDRYDRWKTCSAIAAIMWRHLSLTAQRPKWPRSLWWKICYVGDQLKPLSKDHENRSDKRYPSELCNQSFELPSSKKSKNMIVGTTSSAKTKKWTKIAQKFDITPANGRETEKMTRLQHESSVDCYHNCGLNLPPRLNFTSGFKPVFAAVATIEGKQVIAAIARLFLPRSQRLQRSWRP